MVTLHEAIEHAREVSQRGCTECHKEHGQLAGWLEELERLRAELAKVKAERDAAAKCIADKCRYVEDTERGPYCALDNEPCYRCEGVWRNQRKEGDMRSQKRRAGGAYRRAKGLSSLHAKAGKDRSKSKKKARK